VLSEESRTKLGAEGSQSVVEGEEHYWRRQKGGKFVITYK
jgi:hypothetical protein